MESRSENFRQSQSSVSFSASVAQPHPSGSRQSCLCRSIGKKQGSGTYVTQATTARNHLNFQPSNIVLPVHLFSIPAKRYGALLQKSSSDQYRPHYHALHKQRLLAKDEARSLCSSSFRLWTCTHRQSDIIQ